MSLNCISLVGKSENGSFWGDSSGRWRTKREFIVTGYGAAPSLTSTGYLETITINGISFGEGRIISVKKAGGGNFGQRGLSKDITFWEASIEIFVDGSSTFTNFTGVTIPNLAALESFSESLDSEVDDSGGFRYSHTIKVKMLKANAGFDVIEAAKDVCQAILNGTAYDTAIPSLLQDVPYTRTGRKFYSENFNLANGEYSVTKIYNLSKTNPSTDYTLNTSTKFLVTERGTVDVTESGEITSLSGYSSLSSALSSEISGSFARCGAVFSELRGYIFGSSDSLINQPISVLKTIDVGGEKANYTISYTNSKNIQQALSYSLEETHTISKDSDLLSDCREGSLRAFEKKSSSFNAITHYNTRKTAVLALMPAGYVLKNKSATLGKFGKDISYSFCFTNDPSIRQTGTFRKMEVSVSDTPAQLFHRDYTIPNVSVITARGANVDLSTRVVTISGTLPRVSGQNVFTNIPNVAALSFYNPIKLTLINKCLQVFSNLGITIPVIDMSFFSSNSLSFTSGRDFSAVLEFKYVLNKSNLRSKTLTG